MKKFIIGSILFLLVTIANAESGHCPTSVSCGMANSDTCSPRIPGGHIVDNAYILKGVPYLLETVSIMNGRLTCSYRAKYPHSGYIMGVGDSNTYVPSKNSGWVDTSFSFTCDGKSQGCFFNYGA